MIETNIAFVDETGRGDRCFFHICSVFTMENYVRHERDMRMLRENPELRVPREIKFKKILSSVRHGNANSIKLFDVLLNILKNIDFQWYVSAISVKDSQAAGLGFDKWELDSSIDTFRKYDLNLRGRSVLGLMVMDASVIDDQKRQMYEVVKGETDEKADGAMEKSEGLVGPLVITESQHWPGVWISDGIAYLIHSKINRSVWMREEREAWAILKEFVMRSPEGIISNYGFKIQPSTEESDRIEVEFVEMFE